MNRKIPLSDYFETYRPFSRNGVDWYVISNLTWNPKLVAKHPDEASARNHARHLNALWREEFDAKYQASLRVPDQPPNNLDNASLPQRLKNSLAGILFYLGCLFRLR